MNDYRIEMISLDPRSDYNFVIWHSGINEHEVVEEVNKQYIPFGFEVDRGKVAEVMK